MPQIKKRLIFYVGAVLLLMSASYGYQWLKFRPTRIGAQKAIDEYISRHKALESFGNLELDAPTLTFAKLGERLQKPEKRLGSGKTGSRTGWACSQEDCLIWAWFKVPQRAEIPADEVPLALMVSDTWGSLAGSTQHVSISGASLRESEQQLRESAKKRGFGMDKGTNQITWDEDWNLVWTSVEGKTSSLYFLNEPRLRKAALEEKTVVPSGTQN
jgi:hypothetical protein